MANKVQGEVFDRYPAGGGELLLALAIADHAHDDGTHIFPGVERLARKTRQSERTVQYQLRKMEASGWLILVNDGKGGRRTGQGIAGRPREYRINPAWMAGEDLPPNGVEQGAAGVEHGEKGKGANSAPLSKTPVEHSKGANSAPFDPQPYGDKGCKTEPLRVQNGAFKGATAVAPELRATKSNQEQSSSSSEISDTDTARGEDDVKPPRLPPEQIDAELIGLDCVPPSIDRELLARFMRHRRVSRRPLSISGWLQLLPRFAELSAQGHDLNESLRQTMAAGLVLPVTPAQRPANGASHATTLRPGHESHADRSRRLNDEALARRAAAGGRPPGEDHGDGGAGEGPIDVEWATV